MKTWGSEIMRCQALAIALALMPGAAFASESALRMSPWVASPSRTETAQSFSCRPRKTCGAIASCNEAVWYLHNCSWGGRLDGDSDGSPCETLCGNGN
jgi:hypothetical protein